MTRFELGPGVGVDLDRLVETRLLVQANSGGGKSWCLRRILEQTHGKGYFNNLGRLRSLGLLDYPTPGQVVACPVLFLEER